MKQTELILAIIDHFDNHKIPLEGFRIFQVQKHKDIIKTSVYSQLLLPEEYRVLLDSNNYMPTLNLYEFTDVELSELKLKLV